MAMLFHLKEANVTMDPCWKHCTGKTPLNVTARLRKLRIFIVFLLFAED
jgi:hypothetical protein